MHSTFRTSILPSSQKFGKIRESQLLDIRAICVYMAIGFFMDDDTFYTNEKCLLPAHDYTFDANGYILAKRSHFKWFYAPRDISFNQALVEYKDLLTQIVYEQTLDERVILPISGGLDSRSLAKVLKDLGTPVQAYSYAFEGGYPEQHIAKQIAGVCGFDFQSFCIPKGYLWGAIDELASINGCYSEFTHPRQMAVLPQLKSMSGVFSLGHWGDVLFDRGAPKALKESDVVPFLLKKMLKPSGVEIAEALWRTWNIEGSFKEYLIGRIETALSGIAIDNVSAKVRAFKTLQWAHRWTTTNLIVFREAHPITLPYYDDRMIEFICKVPEAYLSDRRLQIAHLREDKELSSITWQAQRPFNLNTYSYNKIPYNLPYRGVNKLIREWRTLFGNPYIQRNFELQFLGQDNDTRLRSYLFSGELESLITSELIASFYKKFKEENYVYYSHSISMLLTLSLWLKKNKGIL